MAGEASQAGDGDSYRTPDIASVSNVSWMSTLVLYWLGHINGASVLL